MFLLLRQPEQVEESSSGKTLIMTISNTDINKTHDKEDLSKKLIDSSRQESNEHNEESSDTLINDGTPIVFSSTTPSNDHAPKNGKFTDL